MATTYNITVNGNPTDPYFTIKYDQDYDIHVTILGNWRDLYFAVDTDLLTTVQYAGVTITGTYTTSANPTVPITVPASLFIHTVADKTTNTYTYNPSSYTFLPDHTYTDFYSAAGFQGVNITSMDYTIKIRVAINLFTAEADVVDFNALTDSQKATIAAGADTYSALAGFDVVTLPNLTNSNQSVGSNKTLSWDYARTFDAGLGNDTITGSDQADRINGGEGDDTIKGFFGPDVVNGGGGRDTISLTGTSADLNSASDADLFGVEEVSATAATSGVTIDLSRQSDGFSIRGSDFSDTLTGSTFYRDTVRGGKGNDELFGGSGPDILDGGEGADIFHGGNDNFDIVTYAFGETGVGLKLGLDGQAFGDAVGDQILDGVEIILGSNFADSISLGTEAIAVYGGGGSDEIWGTAKNDFLYGDYSDVVSINIILGFAGSPGQAGNDTLSGGQGTDKIFGGGGNDLIGAYAASVTGGSFETTGGNILIGGDGDDSLFSMTADKEQGDTLTGDNGGIGGLRGADKFYVNNNDRITDLQGADTIYVLESASLGLTKIETAFDKTTITLYADPVSNASIDPVIIKLEGAYDPGKFSIKKSLDGQLTEIKFDPSIEVLSDAELIAQRYAEIGKTIKHKYDLEIAELAYDTFVSDQIIDYVLENTKNAERDTIDDLVSKLGPNAGELTRLMAKSFSKPVVNHVLGINEFSGNPSDQKILEEYAKAAGEFIASSAAYIATLASTGNVEAAEKNSSIVGTVSGVTISLGMIFVSRWIDSYFNQLEADLIGGLPGSSAIYDSTGKLIDGYISGGTVFSDDNNNGQLDSTEVSTTTSAKGGFSHLTGAGPLTAFGGTDTSTGLAFKGQLSAPSGSSVVTPLTTLLALLNSDPQAEQKVLSSFGLSSSIDLNTFDPIAATQAGKADGAATMAAVAKVYDTVSLIASTLVAVGGDFSSGVKEAFEAIAAAIGGSGISLTNQAQVAALVAAAAQADGVALGQGVADSVASIIVATNTLLDRKVQSGVTGDALLTPIAAIERVIQGTASNAIQQAGNDLDQLQSLMDAFSGENLDDAVSTVLEHLGVVDTTAPTLTPVADQTNEATSAAGAAAFFTATASDNIDGAVPIVFKEGNTVVHSGDVFSFGTHTVTATAVDAAGNQTSQDFKFNVVDTTAPTLTAIANQSKEATSAAGAAAFFAATATDLVDGAPSVVFKEANTVVNSGDIFSLGSHVITASTTDAAGNLASETFTINVRDTTAPTLAPIADQTLQATTAAGIAAFFTTTASDLVDGTDPVTFMEGNKVVRSGDIFGVGVHRITATAVDAAGNSSTDVFEINVLGIASNNHDPVAIADSKGVAKGKSLSVSAKKGVLANDRDADDDHLSVGSVNGSAANVGHSTKGDYGTLTLNADGSYSYAASAKALPSHIFAQDTFTYTTVDGHGGGDTATLTFSVYDPSYTYKVGSNTILWGDNGKSVLDGSAGHVLAYGGKGADVLIGGNGNILAGGKGPDQFVFRPEFGANTILDFDVKNDHLQFDDSIFSSVKSILDHTTNTALGAVISDGHGDSVLLLGVSKSQLLAHSSDLLIA